MTLTAETRVAIPGPAGSLQAVWAPAMTSGAAVAVVCHPHPLHGGTMDNKVVTTLARTCRDAGFAVLRFNFRGTGESAGVHDEGRGEVDDLLAVLEWLRPEHGDRPLLLAGFSFGAWVCAAAVAKLPADWRLQQLVLVAPPVHYAGFEAVAVPAGTLVIMGDADEVVEPVAMREWALARQPAASLWCLEGASHFFHGRLLELREGLAARLLSAEGYGD
ncbi:MAG: alpha/beta fold hydrolase [Moraxellaceae bacterium]|nr:alpha/beta fold hydrolase [Moraxellaceae bacterium]